jgi:hypothetical protein
VLEGGWGEGLRGAVVDADKKAVIDDVKVHEKISIFSHLCQKLLASLRSQLNLHPQLQPIQVLSRYRRILSLVSTAPEHATLQIKCLIYLDVVVEQIRHDDEVNLRASELLFGYDFVKTEESGNKGVLVAQYIVVVVLDDFPNKFELGFCDCFEHVMSV